MKWGSGACSKTPLSSLAHTHNARKARVTHLCWGVCFRLCGGEFRHDCAPLCRPLSLSSLLRRSLPLCGRFRKQEGEVALLLSILNRPSSRLVLWQSTSAQVVPLGGRCASGPGLEVVDYGVALARQNRFRGGGSQTALFFRGGAPSDFLVLPEVAFLWCRRGRHLSTLSTAVTFVGRGTR